MIDTKLKLKLKKKGVTWFGRNLTDRLFSTSTYDVIEISYLRSLYRATKVYVIIRTKFFRLIDKNDNL